MTLPPFFGGFSGFRKIFREFLGHSVTKSKFFQLLQVKYDFSSDFYEFLGKFYEVFGGNL